MLRPHTSAPGSKLSVLNGIAISSVQPDASMRAFAFQIPSQSKFARPFSKSASQRAPAGLLSKKKPLC